MTAHMAINVLEEDGTTTQLEAPAAVVKWWMDHEGERIIVAPVTLIVEAAA